MAEDRRARRRYGLRFLGWWAVLFGLWLLFVGEWTAPVAIWGIGLSLLAAVSAEVVTRQGFLDARGSWGWVRELGPAAVAVVVDFGILTHVLISAILTGRREIGLFLLDESRAGQGPLPTARRAWVELVATWSPNCYVVDVAPESGRRMVHDLRRHRSSELPS